MADQRLNIIFTGDVSQLESELQSAISGLTKFEQKLKESLGAEGFAAINQSVDQLKQKLNSLQAIDIKANPEKLFAAVREASSELNKLKDSEILLKLNDSKALAQIQSIDKLLSSLSASIKIDANVKTEIDKIKSQLAGLTVKIGADGSVAEAAIKNIQSKLSLLQDEKFIVSADGNQAESVINEIFTDLQTLKDTKVLINADGTPAENVIEQLHTDLQKSLTGNVSIDTAELQRKIQQIGEVDLRLDISEVDAGIKSIRDKLALFQTIDIKANPQQALTSINEILTDISKIKSSELVLSSDNTDVLSDINQIQTRLQEIKSNINISANLDTKNLEALLKPLSTTVSVSINTKAAEAELKALLTQVRGLKGQDILVNLDGTQVVKTIDAIERELLQLQTKLKTATNPADIAKLTQQLQLFKNSLSATNVNQFSSSVGKAQQATFAFSQVLREAPSFAFSLQTGLLGISNNLPILADRFKEARASGLSTSKIFGEMAKGLFSLPGIMTIVSTAAIFLAGSFNKSKNAAKDFSKELAETRDVLSDSAASVQGDIARVQALANAFKNSEGSFERQKKIITELKGVNESYFGDLKAGKTTYEDITKAANAYSDALVQEAVIKGLGNAISKLSEQLGDATIEYADATKAADDQRKVLEKVKKENASVVQGLTAQNQAVNLATNKYNTLQGALSNAGKAVGEINTRIDEFRKLINLKVFEQLKIKPLVDPKVKDDFKKETDDIVERARAFVKQFGEVFVTPDLEESFTNTKDKILKSAKKLIDDISKGNLQIRIPVQVITEVDFLPVQVDVKDTKKEIEELTKGFFEGAKLERQDLEVPVNINVGNIQLLEKVRKIFSDLAAAIPKDIKIKLLDDESFVDFDRLNEAIKQAQNNFLLLQTIGESVGQGLASGFDSVFDALLEGESVFKALGEAVKALVVDVIKAIAKMLILKAITALLTGGASGAAGLIPGLGAIGGSFNPFSGITGGSRANLGGFGSFGSQAAPTLTTRVSGTDLVFVLNQGNNIIGRSG